MYLLLCRTFTDSFARALALRHAAKEEELKPVKESDPLKESAPLVENKSEDGEGTCTKSMDHYCTRRFGRISQLNDVSH